MAFKNYIFVVALSFLTVQAFAETAQKSFGHNLSPSTETLASDQWTAGTYYLGTGLTNDLTIGLSPWMALGYNLENIIVKYKHSGFDDDVVSHQLAYFNSNTKLGNNYKQTSIAYWLTYGLNFSNYKIATTFNYMYFWDEFAPFSLRREPFNKQAQQYTLTTLHQFYFTDVTILQFEVGVLGLNYTYPNLVAGASWLHYFDKSWSLQLGASITKRFTGPVYPDFKDSYINSFENYSALSAHPEIQVQYWF